MTNLACTLTEADMPARLEQIAVLGRNLMAAESEAARAVLRFRADPDTRARAAAFVEAESRCCAFLRMDLREEPGAVTLTIDGPDGSEPIVRDLVAAFAPEHAR